MADRLVTSPRKARPLAKGGALPGSERLSKMSPEDLVRTLNRFGIDPDIAAIEKRANAAFERLDAMLERGVSPDEATWEQVEKQFENDVKKSLRSMTKAAIRNYREARFIAEAKWATWVTSGRSSVCPSCSPRHGQTKTWEAWKKLGEPGSPALICGPECNCTLVPELHGPKVRQAA